MRAKDVWWIVAIACIAVLGLINASPAYGACRAEGNSNVKCILTIKYWTAKRFWGF